MKVDNNQLRRLFQQATLWQRAVRVSSYYALSPSLAPLSPFLLHSEPVWPTFVGRMHQVDLGTAIMSCIRMDGALEEQRCVHGHD